MPSPVATHADRDGRAEAGTASIAAAIGNAIEPSMVSR
jgi:hypothetical protein